MEQSLPEIHKRGLGLAAISYDSPAILKSFADRKQITFPLLSDTDSKTIRTYGILNETVPQGAFYGIPHPGTFILNPQGVIVAKYFEDDYAERFTASDILVKQFGASASAAHSTAARSTMDAKHLRLSSSAGAEVVRSGQRIALALDIEMKPGIHIYAPGVQGYIAIDFAIVQSDAVKVHPAVYPASKMLHLAAIDETVPVYTGEIHVLREITIGKQVKPGELAIEGTFRYQACDDSKCYIPETVPLKWTLRVEPHDRQRAPSEIQHK